MALYSKYIIIGRNYLPTSSKEGWQNPTTKGEEGWQNHNAIGHIDTRGCLVPEGQNINKLGDNKHWNQFKKALCIFAGIDVERF